MLTDETPRDTVVLRDPKGIVFEAEVLAGDGPRVQEKLDKLIRAYEREPALREQLKTTRDLLRRIARSCSVCRRIRHVEQARDDEGRS